MVCNTLKDSSSHTQHMKVSRWSALFIFVWSSMFAFVLGCATRIRLQLQLLRDERTLSGHTELDLKNSTLQLINLRNEAHQNEDLLRKKTKAESRERFFDAVCYEALVHPGLVSHSNPKQVAIVGNGEGVLREVLKHRTVHEVKIFTVDHDEVCSSSFDEPRVEVGLVESLLQTSNPLRKDPTIGNITTFQDDVFDVMIIQNYPKKSGLSIDESLFRAYDALSNNGVLVLPLGAAPYEDGKRGYENRKHLIHRLIGLGFESIHVYEDGNCEFVEPRSVLVAFKEYKTRSNWYRNAAEIQIQLHQRLHNTRSNQSPLLYFDPSNMLKYQVPSKASENMYCLDNDQEDCDNNFGSLPADTVNVPVSNFEVRKSSVSEMAGRGVFAVQDIPRHAGIALEMTVKNFCVMPSTWAVIDSLYSHRDEKNGLKHKIFEGLVYYILGLSQSSYFKFFCAAPYLSLTFILRSCRLWIR
eukprot:CCRYP_000385-RE/>CCRYP_000385-RE protein AED:0.05 eAED:0.05 QI:629/1/1/1/1/0.83/6/648/468